MKSRKKHEDTVEISEELRGDSEESQLDFYVKTIENLRQERDDFYDRFLRSKADFENYRKRVHREKADARYAAKKDILVELLIVLDACEKGLGALPGDGGEAGLAAYREGYELILASLRSLLEKFDVAEVPGVGSLFDPSVHEAVVREETEDHRDGEILEEFRKGYLLGDRLLRPSQVRVAIHPEPHSDQAQSVTGDDSAAG